jgi:hypothetical protein
MAACSAITQFIHTLEHRRKAHVRRTEHRRPDDGLGADAAADRRADPSGRGLARVAPSPNAHVMARSSTRATKWWRTLGVVPGDNGCRESGKRLPLGTPSAPSFGCTSIARLLSLKFSTPPPALPDFARLMGASARSGPKIRRSCATTCRWANSSRCWSGAVQVGGAAVSGEAWASAYVSERDQGRRRRWTATRYFAVSHPSLLTIVSVRRGRSMGPRSSSLRLKMPSISWRSARSAWPVATATATISSRLVSSSGAAR